MLVDKKEPRDATFEEVKAQIIDVVKVEKACSQVEDIAKQIAAGAANADALAGAATAKGMTAKDQKDFVLGSPLGAAAAVRRGRMERAPARACDLVQAFPTFLLALVVLSAVHAPSRLHLGFVFALTAWAPFARLALAQALVFLACAAKSNAVYRAYGAAARDAREYGSREVPAHLRNAPTRLAKELGHGKGYRYAHDEPARFAAGENYFPDDMDEQRYYEPASSGLEIQIGEKLAALREANRVARLKSRKEK